MANSITFHGYGPEQGYEFLRKAIAANEFAPRNVHILPDEILVSDGSKCDIGNFQELFSGDCRVAIPDPVYPVYLDSNVLAGRGGVKLSNGHYSEIVYMPCRAEDDFQPDVPSVHVDVIYLCSPNNPTGTVLERNTLERFVKYARENGSIIFFDAAYVNFIQDDSLVHSIYEIPGAKECAVVYGGEHAPYIWWKLPNGMPSFDFFDRLLNTCGVVGTPGVGFGPEGEGYFRLTAFGNSEMTREALERIAQNANSLRIKG